MQEFCYNKNMDPEKRLRRQSFRVIISEILMVVTVAITVLILAFVVSGYWLSPDFKVERQGMLQISSMPTGADVIVDNESSWLQRTNTSKILSSGEHKVVLEKEGYDSWSKEITIKEGLLYRLQYPRLFPTERTKEQAASLPTVNYAIVSPNHNLMLAANNTTSWQIVKLNSDKVEIKDLDVSKVLTDVSVAEGASSGLFNGRIINATWNRDNDDVLLRVSSGDGYEWVLLDISNTANSINLTREYNANFEKVKIIDNSAKNLLALKGGDLHRIDISNKQLSSVLVKDVYDFDYYEQEIVYSAKIGDLDIKPMEGVHLDVEDSEEKPKAVYYTGIKKIGEDNFAVVSTTVEPALVAIGRFYERDFIATLAGSTVSLFEKADFKPIISESVDFTPRDIIVGHSGDFIAMSDGGKIATLDMEVMATTTWSTGSNEFGWLDGHMIYAVNEGKLNIYDYDSLNHRVLSENVSSHLPVTITDNKWLYYFSDNQLVRERITK